MQSSSIFTSVSIAEHSYKGLPLRLRRPISGIGEDDLAHHLVETVGYAVAVSGSYFFLTALRKRPKADNLWCQVGRKDGKEVTVVASSQQLGYRIEQVAVVHHLKRLGAEIVNGKHPFITETAPFVIVLFADSRKVSGVGNADCISLGVIIVNFDFKFVENLLEGFHKCSFAVAASTAQHNSEFRVVACEPFGNLFSLRQQGFTHYKCLVTAFNFRLHSGEKYTDGVFF